MAAGRLTWTSGTCVDRSALHAYTFERRSREEIIENFVFQNATKIIFGKGTEANVGAETAALGKKVLLHFGGGSIKKTGLYDRNKTSLREAGVEAMELGGVQPNPRLSLVQEGLGSPGEKK